MNTTEQIYEINFLNLCEGYDYQKMKNCLFGKFTGELNSFYFAFLKKRPGKYPVKWLKSEITDKFFKINGTWKTSYFLMF